MDPYPNPNPGRGVTSSIPDRAVLLTSLPPLGSLTLTLTLALEELTRGLEDAIGMLRSAMMGHHSDQVLTLTVTPQY